MGAVEAIVIIYLIILFQFPASNSSAQNGEEWKSATATYSNQTDGSIITALNPFTRIPFTWGRIKNYEHKCLDRSILCLDIYVQGACGYGDLHKTSYGKHSAGLSRVLFDRGSTCGGCFEVKCVDHVLWCLEGSPSVTLTTTDFCPPNYGLPADYGGWCNFPRAHFEMSSAAFAEIADKRADIVPILYRRIKCERREGMRFTVYGSSIFYQVLITNVGSDGQVVAVKVKGSRTGWIPMGRNWGQNWQCNINLAGQPLSFEVITSDGRAITSYNVAPANWRFGQTFEGKQF